MKILVTGYGGREHAFVHTLKKKGNSGEKIEIFSAPGNAGMAKNSQCVNIRPDDVGALLAFAKEQKIDLTLPGPEASFAAGITDIFRANALKIVGPSQTASRLETSKAFAKEFCARHNILTANFEIFDNPDSAQAHVRKRLMPCVVKADGLAGGKGVIIAKTCEEASDAINLIMVQKKFKDAGSRIVIEDFLVGDERSFFVLVGKDGESFCYFDTAQDYKRECDNDQGENTGGMGGYAPMRILSMELADTNYLIVRRTLQGLIKEKMPYQGFLYFGLMRTVSGTYLIEYNVRFGDPEAQLILPFLSGVTLRGLLLDSLEENFSIQRVECIPQHRVCVVLASSGYPREYETGLKISGLEEAQSYRYAMVLHAGTKFSPDGNAILTSGGRVLNILAWDSLLSNARDLAYKVVEHISFGESKGNIHYRKDIALLHK